MPVWEMDRPAIAIIPARGGSKGIPRKNLRMLAGKPLICHSIEAAQRCASIGAVLVSTEDLEIAAVAHDAGALVIHRPLELATDEAPTAPVLIHALEVYQQSHPMPYMVVLLQPTSPLRSAEEIQRFVQFLQDHPAYDSVFSVYTKAPNQSCWYRDEQNILRSGYRYHQRLRRQDVCKTDIDYVENGSIYAIRTPAMLACKDFIGDAPEALITDGETSLDINELEDFKLAESKLVRVPVQKIAG